MSSEYRTIEKGDGTRLQSATPKRSAPRAGGAAGGLLLRGVVTAVYVVDDDSHPHKDGWTKSDPVEMYADVLCYGSAGRTRWTLISRALVSQPVGSGIHDGKLWRPRATTKNVSGAVGDAAVLGTVSKNNNPAHWDGDHVLVGFLDDRIDQPVILGAVPHTQADRGDDGTTERRGLKLKLADGDPSLWRHHGTLYGVEADGDFLVDTRFAHDGKLDAQGGEPAPDTTGKGSQRLRMPLDANLDVTLEDMADPAAPQTKVELKVTRDAADLNFVDSATRLYVDGANELIELGAQGAGDKAPLDSRVQAELGRIRDEFNAKLDAIAKHRHPQEMYYMPLIPNPAKPIVECVKAPLIYADPSTKPKNLITQGDATVANAPMDADAQILEFVGPNIPPTSTRMSGLFPDGEDPGTTASARVTIDK